MPAIDFSEVQGLEPIPEGMYEVEIVYAKEGTSKAGQPKVDLRWKVLEGEFMGRQVFDTLAFHPNALFRVKQTLQALGWDSEFAGEVIDSDLVGLSACIAVTIESSDQVDPETGEPYPDRNRVHRVYPAGRARQRVDDLLD